MHFNLIYLLAIVLHYNMSTNPSIRKQLSGSAKRKLKQMNDVKVNKLRGSMDQFIKKKPNLISEIGTITFNNYCTYNFSTKLSLFNICS